MPQPDTQTDVPRETLTITLPVELVQRIRGSVQQGQFSSESAWIESRLAEIEDWTWLSDQPSEESLEEWERRVVKQYQADVQAGTLRTSPIEEVWARVTARRA